MSDIVERLRGRADRYRQLWGNAAYYTEGDALFDEKTADTITTLRAEVETVGAMHRDACELAKHRMQEVERLRATNERLRAALRQIAGIDPWDNSEQGFVDKARAALAQEKPCSSS